MNMTKRFSYYFLAFALCAVMSLGSLSFIPKASAISSFEFGFPESDIQSYISQLPSSYRSHFICFASYNSSGYYYFYILGLKSLTTSTSIVVSDHSIRFNGGSYLGFLWTSYDKSWHSKSSSSNFTIDNVWVGSPSPYLIKDIPYSGSSKDTFSYSFSKPTLTSAPSYFGFQPFYFPEMPHGYFDGNINVVDGSYNIDFPSNASISGAITQTGNDHYTWTWNHGTLYWNGETVQGEHEGWLSPDYQHQTPPNGDISQTAYANRLINLSLSDLDSVVNYTPAYNENSRFRCWSCVMDSSYVWFVSDTRNKITGSIVSVSSSEVSWKYDFSDPQGGNTIYPVWAIVFSPMGEVIQVLSPNTVANKNTYTLSCSIGTLEQHQDTGIWSCDPLYHGFWFSDDSPPVANITHLNVAENKKYLSNPVFGESAFQLEFLDSINRGISDINNNIQSLQSAMQSSISGQTSDFQNMDAPSAPQPSTSQMMDYFSKESAFSAPNTDEVFSGDIKSGHYWDGVTWWSTKFNDIIVSNQVIVAFTTAMLTLGLAVLIIGRRFSMR